MYVIKFDDGSYNYEEGHQCLKDEATRYPTKEEASNVAMYLTGVKGIEEVFGEDEHQGLEVTSKTSKTMKIMRVWLKDVRYSDAEGSKGHIDFLLEGDDGEMIGDVLRIIKDKGIYFSPRKLGKNSGNYQFIPYQEILTIYFMSFKNLEDTDRYERLELELI